MASDGVGDNLRGMAVKLKSVIAPNLWALSGPPGPSGGPDGAGGRMPAAEDLKQFVPNLFKVVQAS